MVSDQGHIRSNIQPKISIVAEFADTTNGLVAQLQTHYSNACCCLAS